MSRMKLRDIPIPWGFIPIPAIFIFILVSAEASLFMWVLHGAWWIGLPVFFLSMGLD